MRSKFGYSSQKKRQRGTALVELALLSPFLLALAIGVADFGRVMYASIVVKNAARAGAQFALDSRYTQTSAIAAAAVQDVGTSLPGFSTSGTPNTCGGSPPAANTGCVSVATSCPCPGDAIPGSQPCSPVPTCATGSPMAYVSVTTKYTFTTLTQYPGFPHSVPLTGTAIIRAQ